MLIICFKSTSKLAHYLPVAQNCSRITAQHFVGIADYFVPLLIIKIEASGKGKGGLTVEVVFGDIVIIGYDRQCGLNILVDGLINLGNSATILLIGKRFNFFRYGNTQVLVGCCRVVHFRKFGH